MCDTSIMRWYIGSICATITGILRQYRERKIYMVIMIRTAVTGTGMMMLKRDGTMGRSSIHRMRIS